MLAISQAHRSLSSTPIVLSSTSSYIRSRACLHYLIPVPRLIRLSFSLPPIPSQSRSVSVRLPSCGTRSHIPMPPGIPSFLARSASSKSTAAVAVQVLRTQDVHDSRPTFFLASSIISARTTVLIGFCTLVTYLLFKAPRFLYVPLAPVLARPPSHKAFSHVGPPPATQNCSIASASALRTLETGKLYGVRACHSTNALIGICCGGTIASGGSSGPRLITLARAYALTSHTLRLEGADILRRTACMRLAAATGPLPLLADRTTRA